MVLGHESLSGHPAATQWHDQIGNLKFELESFDCEK